MKKVLNVIYEFKSFGQDITMYILMHTIGGIFFSYTILLPVFMNKLNISISEAGVFLGIASINDLIFTYLLRRSFDKVSPNTCMALDWISESFPVIIFAFATTKLHFLIGSVAQKLTNILNPSYRIYENDIFPEEKRSLIYTYHLFVPQIMTIIIFPILGYVLTYKFNSIFAYRVTFLIFGLGFIGVSLIPYKVLKYVKPTKLNNTPKQKLHISKNLYLVATSEILVVVAREFTSVFITIYFVLDKLNGNLMQILIVEMIASIGTIITGILSRNIEKKLSNERICQLGIIIFIVYTSMMFLAKNFAMVLIANIINSIGHTIWFPAQSTLLMKLVPQKERGEFFKYKQYIQTY